MGARRSGPGENDGNPLFHGRTALDDIHSGQFVEWQDEGLTSDGIEAASEYLESIEERLMLSTPRSEAGGAADSNRTQVDGRIKRRQMLFARAYETSFRLPDSAPSRTVSTSYSNIQELRHAQLVASSWATLAAAEDGEDARSSSIVMQALATRDTAERLRLGLAMMLDSQMPGQDTSGEMEESSGNTVGGSEENGFQ